LIDEEMGEGIGDKIGVKVGDKFVEVTLGELVMGVVVNITIGFGILDGVLVVTELLGAEETDGTVVGWIFPFEILK
jgi:hypothetical protein